MVRLKSRTGKVHIKLEYYTGNRTLCNFKFYSNFPGSLEKTNEPVTCKHCLYILKKANPGVTMQQLVCLDEPFVVKVCFGSKVNSIQTFFKTKAEKAAYIQGVRDALLKIRASYVTIDGEKV